jgi:hypothetical protein
MNEHPSNVIELRLRDVAQLFNTLDPFPFRERDIAPAAEEYIVDWAEDLPRDRPIRIVIHLQTPTAAHTQSDIRDAICGWFAGRAKSETNAMRTLFHDGRLALGIGVVLLAGCMSVAWFLTQRYSGGFARLIQESFIIVGWVVIWRPAEMFLYDWVPMLRRRNLFRRLAVADVGVVTDPPAI